MRIYDIEFDIDCYLTELEQRQRVRRSNGLCVYCGAPDNGTCAYPSEGKPGCFQKHAYSAGTP